MVTKGLVCKNRVKDYLGQGGGTPEVSVLRAATAVKMLTVQFFALTVDNCWKSLLTVDSCSILTSTMALHGLNFQDYIE